MKKPTIKFQPVFPEPSNSDKAKAKGKPKKRKDVTKDTPLKIFLNSTAIGFIRVNPLTVFIKGTQLPGKFISLNSAKASAINYISEKCK